MNLNDISDTARWVAVYRAMETERPRAPAEGTRFFKTFGWREKVSRYSLEEAQRLHREMQFAGLMRFVGHFLPARTREEFLQMSSIVLLERANQ